MKAYKIEIAFIDPDGDYNLRDIVRQTVSEVCCISHFVSLKSTEIGEWYEEHPLNLDDKNQEFIKNAIWEPEPETIYWM